MKGWLSKVLILLLLLGIISSFFIYFMTKSTNIAAVDNLIMNYFNQLGFSTHKVQGETQWQFFPRPGLILSKIQLQDEEQGFSFYAKKAHLNLQLGAILQGKIIFDSLLIDNFNVLVNLDNHVTLEKLPLNEAQQKLILDKRVSLKAKILVSDAVFTRGRATFIHSGKRLSIENFQLKTSHLNFTDQYFPFISKGDLFFYFSKDHQFKSDFNFNGRIHLSRNFSSFKNLHQIIEGNLALKNLSSKHLFIDEVNASLITTADEVLLNPFNFLMYGGKSVGDLRYNVVAKKLDINQTATSLNAEALLKNSLQTPQITGKLDYSVHSAIRFNDDNWKDDIIGSGSITIRNGTLHGADLNELSSQISSSLHHLLDDKRDQVFHLASGQTQFNLLTAQFKLKNSFTVEDHFVLQTEHLQLSGSGNLNIKEQTINNALSLTIISPNQLLQKIQTFLAGSWPLIISGKWSNPVIQTDADKLKPLVAKFILDESLKSSLNNIKEKLQNYFAPSSL
jgi:AsmA protein